MILALYWRWISDKLLFVVMRSKGTDACITRPQWFNHFNDVIMSAMASQITSNTVVFSTIYSGRYQRKRQGSAPLTFVRGIHRWPANSPHNGPVTQKCLHLMMSSRTARWGATFSSWRTTTLTKIIYMYIYIYKRSFICKYFVTLISCRTITIYLTYHNRRHLWFNE